MASGTDYCEAHLERTGQQVPAYKLGLCRDCYKRSILMVSGELLKLTYPSLTGELDAMVELGLLKKGT